MAAPPVPAPEAQPRDARLDGLRGIAITLVFLYHASFFWLAESPFEIALVLVPAMGLYGVDLFFVLSGFLITGILLRTRGTPGYFRTFYARRSLRIFPAYYAVLVLFLLVFPLATSQADQFWKPGADRETLWYWTYLSNFHVAWTARFHHHFLFLSWSLAIEEQFYLVWPLVVSLLSRRGLARLCWALVVGALALRAGLVAAEVSPLVPYVLTPCRLDALATGALLAIYAGDADGVRRLARPARWGLVVGLGLFAGFVVWRTFFAVAAGEAPTGLLDGESRLLFYTSDPLVQTVGYTLLCLGFGSLLVLALAAHGTRLAAALSWAPLVSLGTYSYGIYLLHRFAVALARNLVDPTRPEGGFVVSQLAFWGVALALSWTLAWVSWHVLEGPVLRLKRFFPYRVAPHGGDTGR